jgi:thiol-disulfide isomerase/thioredoxin
MKTHHLLIPLLLATATLALAAPPEKSTPPALGIQAPEISAVTLDNKPLHLTDLRGKPVVLEFGSATEPLFRARAKAVETLAQKYGDKVAFLVLYTKESHAADSPDALDLNTDDGFSFAQPTKLDERIALARQTAERLNIPASRIAVDQWNNFSSKIYGNYPNMTFVIDAKGNLQAGYPWMDTGKLVPALDALLAGKPVPSDVRGHTKAAAPDGSDIANMTMDMANTRGPQGIGVMLDHLSLTPQQKTALYPAVGQFFSDLRQFRGIPANGAPAAAGDASVTPEEYQKLLENLRTSARNLDAVAKQTLPDADYQKLAALLQQGPQMKRLFTADLPPKK